VKRAKYELKLSKIPTDILEAAYCVDLGQSKLQLEYDRKIMKKYGLVVENGFLKGKLPDGTRIYMEWPEEGQPL